MPRFSVLSRNVENAGVATKEVGRIVAHVQQHDPDVSGLIEVVGAGIYDRIVKRFPGHSSGRFGLPRQISAGRGCSRRHPNAYLE